MGLLTRSPVGSHWAIGRTDDKSEVVVKTFTGEGLAGASAELGEVSEVRFPVAEFDQFIADVLELDYGIPVDEAYHIVREGHPVG